MKCIKCDTPIKPRYKYCDICVTDTKAYYRRLLKKTKNRDVEDN